MSMRKQELHPRTVVLNKSQKNHSKKARMDALLWLASNFPAAFDNSVRIRPLKIGIMTDILEFSDKATADGISRSKLREAVVLFTRRLDYLTCLKTREMRIDLNGDVVSEVTEEEAQHAASKIKKRVEKSVRNARKMLINNSTANSNDHYKKTTYTHSKPFNQTPEDFIPVYPARAPAFSDKNTPQQASKASVVVTHKTTRQFDPSVVARLKEKLGLSKTENKETSE